MGEFFKKVKGLFGTATNIITSDGPKISYEHTKAAFNLIKLKTDNRILVISSIASFIFLGFYGYLIYLNVDPYSLRHIIIYSILATILFISFIINIVINPSRQNKMSKDEKAKAKRIKNIWKGINFLISTLTKLVSLGFMLYEIITIDSSIKRLIPFGLSTLALMMQLAITYISRLFIYYYEIFLVGVDEDINSSGIVQALTNNQFIDPIRVSGSVNQASAGKISQKIADQVDNNKRVKEKDFKDLLYKAAIYSLNNPITLDGIMSRFDIGIIKASKVLNKLEKLGIISKGNSKVGRMLITDQHEIKYIIYTSK